VGGGGGDNDDDGGGMWGFFGIDCFINGRGHFWL
jgi:hypothetical protein